MTISFTTDQMLNFGDCDISGTADYPAYLNILNAVVEEFWTVIGFPWHEIIWKERWGTPTVHLSCDFSEPSFFGDRLTFRLTILKVGKSSVRINHTVHCGEEFRCSGEQVLAASLLVEHATMPWPPAVKAKLESFLPPDQAQT